MQHDSATGPILRPIPPASQIGAVAATPTLEEVERRIRGDWLDRLARANGGIARTLDAIASEQGSGHDNRKLHKLASDAMLNEFELALSREALCRHLPTSLASLHNCAESSEAALLSLSNASGAQGEAILAAACENARAALAATSVVLGELKG